MIPHNVKDLQGSIKDIKIITLSSDTIVWNVPDFGTKITLNRKPLCLKFELDNQENLSKLRILIQEHFNEMKPLALSNSIRKDACKQLRDSIYLACKIDGEMQITYNKMSLLHFFGTWLGPTSDKRKEGHAIMNNLHYELFGFHQYHGK